MKKVPIRLHTANALKWLGSLYRNPTDAIKEHVSNAIDEHLKAKALGRAVPACTVMFALSKSVITIEYPYGMSGDEFLQALQKVADSAKRTLSVNLIGQLGIGMFSFLQLGKKCTFLSKKDRGYETTKVTLREGPTKRNSKRQQEREPVGPRHQDQHRRPAVRSDEGKRAFVSREAPEGLYGEVRSLSEVGSARDPCRRREREALQDRALEDRIAARRRGLQELGAVE